MSPQIRNIKPSNIQYKQKEKLIQQTSLHRHNCTYKMQMLKNTLTKLHIFRYLNTFVVREEI